MALGALGFCSKAPPEAALICQGLLNRRETGPGKTLGKRDTENRGSGFEPAGVFLINNLMGAGKKAYCRQSAA